MPTELRRACREHERRVAKREERIRRKHPRLGGLILAVSDAPQTTKAPATGAVGEERLGRRLDATAGPLVRVLHDRGIPGSRANLDHLVVCERGVFVVDAKRYQGRPRLVFEGGLFTPRTEKLLVGRRDGTKLVDAGLTQADLVREALADDAVEVRSVLCFVEADWPLLASDFAVRGVTVTWPKKLAATIARPGPLTEEQVAAVHRRLATAFPPAQLTRPLCRARSCFAGMHDPSDALREVDLLAATPLPFSTLRTSSDLVDVDGVGVRVASVEHLVAMKRLAGRAQDLADIEALAQLMGRPRVDRDEHDEG